MKVEIFKRETQKNDGNPNYIVWDMDEMKRLTIARTYERAIEMKRDWENLKISMENKEYDQMELPFT